MNTNNAKCAIEYIAKFICDLNNQDENKDRNLGKNDTEAAVQEFLEKYSKINFYTLINELAW